MNKTYNVQGQKLLRAVYKVQNINISS